MGLPAGVWCRPWGTPGQVPANGFHLSTHAPVSKAWTTVTLARAASGRLHIVHENDAAHIVRHVALSACP